ncbi:MAG: hypothetical protein KAT58_06680 [candidate division Zixibacteria bacterium]|nr:hypothetical protein [candidate division Zixibacteria bacterium]
MIKRLLLLFVVITWTGGVLAGELTQSGQIGGFLQENDLKTYQRLQEYNDLAFASGFDDFPLPADVFDYSYRSPGRAFFSSLLVPGGGQWYNQSKTKAAVFFGIELIFWYGYFSYHGTGKDREEEYRDYADQYWSPELYRNWLIEEKGVIDDEDTTLFTHHLPNTMTQQYYEMIGKYDQFNYGWHDTDYRSNDSNSVYRTLYLEIRDRSNDAFGKAKIVAIFSIANHLISAFEAALAAKRYNRSQDSFARLRVKASLASYGGETIPRVTLTYGFF